MFVRNINLALFDFDGTITSKDSLFDFIRYAVGDFRFFFGILLLLPMFVVYKLKIIPNYVAKEELITYFFKGYKDDVFINLAKEYSLTKLDNLVRAKAIDRILWHKKQGHKVVVVSASIDYWLSPWCKLYNIDLLSTKLEINNGIITGKFSGNNCYGAEKVKQINNYYNLADFDYIFAYGDSRGDKEMLEIANESFYKYFN
uniref:HAD family hydrolase n=1 Tax=Algoriphagus sp. TaxID=1872435 RepID=UPI00404867AF